MNKHVKYIDLHNIHKNMKHKTVVAITNTVLPVFQRQPVYLIKVKTVLRFRRYG